MTYIRNMNQMVLFCAVTLSFFSCACKNTMDARPKEDRQILIEVVNNASDLVYPPGKTLTLRVFDTGEIEFDYFPEYGPDRAGIPFTSQLKTAKIDSQQLNRFKDLIEELESETPKTVYSPTQRILDSNIEVSLTYRSKAGDREIVLKENDSHLHFEQGNSYPPALVKTLRLVYEIYFENRRKLLAEGSEK